MKHFTLSLHFSFIKFSGMYMRVGLYRQLFEELNTNRGYLERLAGKAPTMYKVYTIPKRTSGERLIAHPAKRLKLAQRVLCSNILSKLLPIHPKSFAYKKNFSIKDNALQHAGSKYLLKMDFNDFFNSITPAFFYQECCRHEITFSDAEQRLLENLLFWNKSKKINGKKVLSVGAPSSPLISNFVMYAFDEAMATYCKKELITYTRYADDLTFTTNYKNHLFTMPRIVKDLLGELYRYQISVNDFKTVFSSKATNRHVTGITLTNEGKISIGRSRKRMISSMIHKYKLCELDEIDQSYLQGMLAFAQNIEPNFVDRMRKKYSKEIVKEIMGNVNAK